MQAVSHALVLNADYQPLKVIAWQQAVLLVLDEKADLVTEYVGRLVRSTSLTVPWPAVIRLRKFVKTRGRLRFNRQNILARDNYTCSYCRVKPKHPSGRPALEELTLDHVIPRAQSRDGMVVDRNGRRLSITCWENVVTACVACNIRKADRTPDQAGLKLHGPPRIPTSLDVLRMTMTRIQIPDEWQEYLPVGSEWRGYWTEELE